MTDQKVWFITGAGRGMGIDLAKAALAAGNAVVATARKPTRSRVPGPRRTSWPSNDVTGPSDAEAAARPQSIAKSATSSHPGAPGKCGRPSNSWYSVIETESSYFRSLCERGLRGHDVILAEPDEQEWDPTFLGEVDLRRRVAVQVRERDVGEHARGRRHGVALRRSGRSLPRSSCS